MEPWLPGHFDRDVHGLTLVVKASCGVCTGRSRVVELWPAFGGNEVTSKELARNEVPTKAQGRPSCTTPPGFALAPLGADDAHRKWGFDSSEPEGSDLYHFFFRASSYLFGGVLFLVVQFGGNSELRNSFESRPGSPLPASDGQLHALCGRSLVLVRERFSAEPCRAALLCDRSPWRRLRRILTREEGVLVAFLHGGNRKHLRLCSWP